MSETDSASRILQDAFKQYCSASQSAFFAEIAAAALGLTGRRSSCPYCGIPNDPPKDSLFVRISEQHNRCRICGDVVSNSSESRDAHLNEKGCHCA